MREKVLFGPSCKHLDEIQFVYREGYVGSQYDRDVQLELNFGLNTHFLQKDATQNSTYRVVKYSKPFHRDITITEHTSKMMMTLLRRREATNKWEVLDE